MAKKKNSLFKNWGRMSMTRKLALLFLLFILIALPVSVLVALKPTSFPSFALNTKELTLPFLKTNFGQALSLNGTDSYIEINNSENLDPKLGYTVEAWVKLNQFNPSPPASDNYENVFTVIGKGGFPPEFRLWMTISPRDADSYNIDYHFNVSDKGPYPDSPQSCYQGRGVDRMSSYILSGSYADALVWHHVAGVLQPDGTMEVYVDGKKSPYPVKFYEVCPNSEPGKIGAVTLTSAYYPAETKSLWNGLIDELRLSNVARYNEDFTPVKTPFSPDENTVSLYHFNDDLLDASGNDYHGTAVGNVGFVPSTILDSEPSPTAAPKLTQPPAECVLRLNQEDGTLKYSLNNAWQHYVPFTANFTGLVDKISVKAGNWSNSARAITCKVTNENGDADIGFEQSSQTFTANNQTDWREITFTPFALKEGNNYRLYCKGPDVWNSIFWIYNRDNNLKTFRIYSCQE